MSIAFRSAVSLRLRGQQSGEMVGGGGWQGGQRVAESRLRFNSERTARRGETGDRGLRATAPVGTEEQPILVSNGERLDGTLSGVVVDRQTTVADVGR